MDLYSVQYYKHAIVHASVSGGFRASATFEAEIFVRISNGFWLRTFVTESTIFVVERILYLLLLSVLMSSSIFWHKRSLFSENITAAYLGTLLICSQDASCQNIKSAYLGTLLV